MTKYIGIRMSFKKRKMKQKDSRNIDKMNNYQFKRIQMKTIVTWLVRNSITIILKL